jgi:sulfopyruvate decarboxylase subunit alpha
MSVVIRHQSSAAAMAVGLAECGFSPFFGTPCGILAPLYDYLSTNYGLMTIPREDNAVGVAAGCALSGQKPVVLMQNSGLGQSVNAIASLVAPYRLAILFIISMRGTDHDLTEENQVMGRTTELLLASAGIPTARVGSEQVKRQVAWASRTVIEECLPAALLIPPALFGWGP